jgi:Transglycosylase-like domain
LLAIVISALVLTGVAQAAEKIPAHKQSWQYRWQVWLPDKWQRIGACETGYGKRPGDWKWNSGTYQGAFGFHKDSWDRFRPKGYPSEAYLATPWQQYRVALRIYARYGFTGWGCRNA